MNNDIDFKAIYKDLDRQQAIEKLIKNVIPLIIGIIFILFALGIIFGYIPSASRCGIDKIGDARCWPEW